MLYRITTILLLFCTPLLAVPKEKGKNQTGSIGFSNELFGEPFLKGYNGFYRHFDENQDVAASVSHFKSAPTGLFLSLLIPGTGEFYAGSKLKGLFFIGLEVGAWFMYSHHKKLSDNWENLYIKMANDNWSRTRWEIWWESLSFQDQEQFLGIQLPAKKNRDFYEAIGIYEKFNAGWKNAEWELGVAEVASPSSKKTYMKWRNNSNDALKLSTLATSVVMINHLVSALDAAWSVSRYNKNVKPSVKVKYVFANPEPQVLAGIQITL